MWRWLWLLLLWPVASIAVEHLNVPDICGFVSVQVCVAVKSHIKVARVIHVRPSAITALSNPEDSPPDCIRLIVGARQIYVVGTYDQIAARLHKAQREVDDHECHGQEQSDGG